MTGDSIQIQIRIISEGTTVDLARGPADDTWHTRKILPWVLRDDDVETVFLTGFPYVPQLKVQLKRIPL